MTILDVFQTITSTLTDQRFISKSVLIILLGLYGLFAIILAIQTDVLNRIVSVSTFSPLIKTISFVHAFLVIALLVAAILFL
ncbi:hypothetical protein M1146_03605 [Patescibacteria group bacterium]|nr:hypothetical protein [Patescibacteria group bacterium]